MKVAVTYEKETGQVFQHFGHCENFKIYEVRENQVVSSQVVSAVGSGHGALAGFLQNNDVQVLICGGIGGGARVALGEARIQLYPGVFGDADKSVSEMLDGTLTFDLNKTCNHHHEGEHNCKEHKCDEEKHGCSGNH